MDNDLLKLAIHQGLGHVLVCIRCPHCGYIPEEGKEELAMHFADTPCPHCNQMNP
jgi:rubrerythrin